MKKDIGIGIIGIGMGISSFKLNEVKESRFEVRGVCSARPKEKARRILDRWGIDYYTNDYNELIAREDVDIIGVYSPDKMHYEHCRAALYAGKHVVITKPITEKSEDAIDIARLAAKKKLKILVGQTLRFEPQTVALKQMFDDGSLGKYIFVESHYIHDMREMYRLTPWRLEKNWIVGAGCHPIDAVRWYLGDINEIHAFGNQGKVSDYAGMDNFIINMKFDSGAIARVLLLIGVVESPEPMMKISVFGNRGSGFATHTDNKGGILKAVLDKAKKESMVDIDFPAERGLDIYGHTETVIRYMKYFEDCIVNDIEPSPNAVDGAKTLIASESVLRSINEGKAIEIDNDFMDK